jgi:origin recognition complex subunit 1
MRWDPFSGSYVSAVIEKPRRRGRPAREPSEPMTSDVRLSGRSLARERPCPTPPPAPSKPQPAQASGSAPVSQRGARAKGPRWIGKPTSLGAGGERFYQGVIVDDEHFHAGDDVAMATGTGINEVFVGRIISLWETSSGDGEMELKWYYAPEDTSSGRLAGHDPREIFESVHTDENPVAAIDGHVRVLGWDEYQRWLDAPFEGDEDEDEQDTYVCRAQYHPGTGEFMPLNGASSLSEAARRLTPCSAGPSHSSAAQPPPCGPGGRRLSRFSEAARVLTPHAAPTRLPCREKEEEEVTSALRAAIAAGGQATSLYISGTPGTGKTATVHHALRTLAGERSLPPFRTLEINGMKLSAPQQVYSLLWEGLTGQHVPSQRAATLLEKRFSVADKRRKGAQVSDSWMCP